MPQEPTSASERTAGDAAMRRILQSAPNCLADYQHRPVEVSALGVTLDGHNSPFDSAFEVGCKTCGAGTHEVIAYRWRDAEWPARIEDVFLSPLMTRCGGCGREAVVFDSQKHGYDPVVNNMTPSRRAEGSREAVACETCGKSRFELWTRFEYSPSISTFVEFCDRPQLAGREQNLFSWFTLVGQCAACGERGTLAHYETD